jgi:hypothetical protein
VYDDGVDNYMPVTTRAYARSGRGQDGLTKVFQVATTPGTTYTITIGQGGGAGDFMNPPWVDGQGFGGGAIIEYVK